jgi:hypothetical protein
VSEYVCVCVCVSCSRSTSLSIYLSLPHSNNVLFFVCVPFFFLFFFFLFFFFLFFSLLFVFCVFLLLLCRFSLALVSGRETGEIDNGGIVATMQNVICGEVDTGFSGTIKDQNGSLVVEIDTTGLVKGNANTTIAQLEHFSYEYARVCVCVCVCVLYIHECVCVCVCVCVCT